MKPFTLVLLLSALPSLARAEEAPPTCPGPCDGKCLTAQQVSDLKQAVNELDDIHKSPATVQILDPVVIVRDWDGRVYVNGGSTAPLKAKVKIGSHVDRDLAIVLAPQVWYRPDPPSPMFRTRIRAQVGVMFPAIWQGADSAKTAYDAGVALDFFHLDVVNLAVYAGIRSVGIGPGVDVTKNFGMYAGYALTYDGLKSGALVSAYFSFN